LGIAQELAETMRGASSLSRAAIIDSRALNYAEVKAIASGNPLVIEKASIDTEIAAWVHAASLPVS
jgi:hypothetical protein